VCIPLSAERRKPVVNLFGLVTLKVTEHDHPQNGLVQHTLLSDVSSVELCDICASYECDQCPDALSTSGSSPSSLAAIFNCHLPFLICFVILHCTFFDRLWS
jgi:hypothetical protein